MLDVDNRNLFYNILYKVAIYLRLSRDDETVGDSESIINQREFLTKYIKQYPNWELVDIYVDDGYTGTNFERPEFKK